MGSLFFFAAIGAKEGGTVWHLNFSLIFNDLIKYNIEIVPYLTIRYEIEHFTD